MGYPGTTSPTITGIDTVLDNVHDTDLPAVKTVVDAIEVDTTSIESKVDTIDGILDDLHGTDIPDIHTDVADIHTDVADIHTDVADIHADVAAATATTNGISQARLQVLQVSTTAAANSGAATIATATNSVTIEDIIVKMVTYHADLTSVSVTGGASDVIDFIDVSEGAAANLDAADKQVAWAGAVELGNAKTIKLTLAGTGANNVSVLTTIRYRANEASGALS